MRVLVEHCGRATCLAQLAGAGGRPLLFGSSGQWCACLWPAEPDTGRQRIGGAAKPACQRADGTRLEQTKTTVPIIAISSMGSFRINSYHVASFGIIWHHFASFSYPLTLPGAQECGMVELGTEQCNGLPLLFHTEHSTPLPPNADVDASHLASIGSTKADVQGETVAAPSCTEPATGPLCLPPSAPVPLRSSPLLHTATEPKDACPPARLPTCLPTCLHARES